MPQEGETTEAQEAEAQEPGGEEQQERKRPEWWTEQHSALPETAQRVLLESTAEANRQAAKYRSELRATEKQRATLESQVKEHEAAGLSELERRDARILELDEKSRKLELSLREATVDSAVRDVAVSLNFTDPSDAVALLPRRRLDYDPDGVPMNVRELLTEVAQAKPHLLRRAGNAGGGEGGTGTPMSMSDLIRTGARRTHE